MEALGQFFAIYGSLVNFIGINALLALSLYLTLAAGQLSLGSAAFAAIGGYTAGILTMKCGFPFLLSVAIGSILSGLVGLVIGLPVLRLRGVFLAIATLSFGEVVRIIVLNLDITGGAQGLVGIPNLTKTWGIYLTLALAGYSIARLRRSRAGWCFESIREDETAAAAMGINTTYYKTLAFTLGALLAGLAGGLYAHLNYIITPREFGFSVAVDLLIYNIVGGVRCWYGPMLGAFLLTALPEILRGTGVAAGPVRMAANGLILLLVILFLPNGLVSVFTRPGRPQAGLPPAAVAEEV
ncbi:MAG: branched-chain amino acid ABC transporter permease [Desulfocapsaceae bacterium]|nr:branched-chain amino acid ABC transporter permease [Desulfocapsaceae bacterium]